MNGDSYNITRAEGGFIVYVNRPYAQSPGGALIEGTNEPRVFTDSSALIDYLHNELVRSN